MLKFSLNTNKLLMIGFCLGILLRRRQIRKEGRRRCDVEEKNRNDILGILKILKCMCQEILYFKVCGYLDTLNGREKK